MVEGKGWGGGGRSGARYCCSYKKRQCHCVNQRHLSADHIRIPFLMSYDATILKYLSYFLKLVLTVLYG